MREYHTASRIVDDATAGHLLSEDEPHGTRFVVVVLWSQLTGGRAAYVTQEFMLILAWAAWVLGSSSMTVRPAVEGSILAFIMLFLHRPPDTVSADREILEMLWLGVIPILAGAWTGWRSQGHAGLWLAGFMVAHILFSYGDVPHAMLESSAAYAGLASWQASRMIGRTPNGIQGRDGTC